MDKKTKLGVGIFAIVIILIIVLSIIFSQEHADGCPPGAEKIAGLCYLPCPQGYKRDGTGCKAIGCPAFFDGSIVGDKCFLPNLRNRGQGYANLCEQKYGKGNCEIAADGLTYPKCPYVGFPSVQIPKPPYTAILQSDGNFVIMAASGPPIWATNTAGEIDSAPPTIRNQMSSDGFHTLIDGALMSGMRGASLYQLIFRSNNGILTLYKGQKTLWQSSPDMRGTPPYKLVMQRDGDLVIYDKYRPIWSSHTAGMGGEQIGVNATNDTCQRSKLTTCPKGFIPGRPGENICTISIIPGYQVPNL